MKMLQAQPLSTNPQGNVVTRAIIGFSLVCCFNVLYFLSQAASPVIRSDAWYFLDSLVVKWATTGFDWIDFFVKRSISDHAQPANKLALFLNYKLFHLDFKVEALFGFVGFLAFIAIFIKLYFDNVELKNRNYVSGFALIGSVLVIASMNATEAYTWPLVTFFYIYLFLAAMAALMTWRFLEGKSAVAALATTAGSFLLLGDTATVIVWSSLLVCVTLTAIHGEGRLRRRGGYWIAATTLFVFVYFLAINGKFLFQASGPADPQVDHLVRWLDPSLYLEVVRIVFSASLVHALHLQSLGDFSRPLSWILALLVGFFYVRFFANIFSRRVILSAPKFFVTFLLVYATVSVVAIVVGRVPVFGVDYLNQPRYVFSYQLIPFSLLFDFSFSKKQIAVSEFSPYVISLSLVLLTFLSIQASFIASAYKTVPWLSQYYDAQTKVIGHYLINESMPIGECTDVSVPICNMDPDKRNYLLQFLEEKNLNIFNTSFQRRYRFFPFDSNHNTTIIDNWGPKYVESTGYQNFQCNVWIEAKGLNIVSEYIVDIDGYKILPIVSKNLVTFTVPDEIVAMPGQHLIILKDNRFDAEVPVGILTVDK